MVQHAAPPPHAGHAGHAHPTPRTYLRIGAILMALLVVTIIVGQLPLGQLTIVFGLIIAAVKATLVALYFMELKYRSPLTTIFALAGVFWLGIMMTLTLSDYLSRGLLGTSGIPPAGPPSMASPSPTLPG